MADWTSNGTLVAGIVGIVTAVTGVFAGRRSKQTEEAEADTTLGHGWSEFSDALREEAREERELRRLVEERLTERDFEWEMCKQQLSAMHTRFKGLLEWLRSMGLEPPGWIEDEE